MSFGQPFKIYRLFLFCLQLNWCGCLFAPCPGISQKQAAQVGYDVVDIRHREPGIAQFLEYPIRVGLVFGLWIFSHVWNQITTRSQSL